MADHPERLRDMDSRAWVSDLRGLHAALHLKIWGVPPVSWSRWLHKVPPVDVPATSRRARPAVRRWSHASHAPLLHPDTVAQSVFDAILAPVRDHVITGCAWISWTDIRGMGREHEFKARLSSIPPHGRSWLPLSPTKWMWRALCQDGCGEHTWCSLWQREYERDWHWLYDPRLDVEEHRHSSFGNFALDSRGTVSIPRPTSSAGREGTDAGRTGKRRSTRV